MASFRIHVDQENRVPELRQKPSSSSNNAMAAQQQQKRSVLGAIDGNKLNNVALGPKQGKQPLRESKTLKEDVEPRRVKNLVAPVVPVAQFEAFKVYEDDEAFVRRAPKDKILEEAVEEARQEVKSNVVREEPMSLEKYLADEENDEEFAVQVDSKFFSCRSTQREYFFEVDEYREDIYSYLRQLELRHRPKPGYIVKQPDITENMRCILVDWLVEVTEEYQMGTETLYLAVNFIDRFLSYMSVVRAKLQLVGTAAMFIASKYEEIYPPHVNEFVYITDDTYDKHQVFRMEHLILKVLGFDLSVPTPLAFINVIATSSKQNEETINLAKYLSELSLLDVELYLRMLPSKIASSAIALARHTLGMYAWNYSLQKCTGYSLADLRQGIVFLHMLFVKAPSSPQHAIQDKYKSAKFFKVSTIQPSNDIIRFDE